ARIASPCQPVLAAESELAAPGRAPGDAQAHALEARLARGLDHAPDDVGAERAVAAAERQALAAPAVTDVGRGLGERDQGGLGHGPGDADVDRKSTRLNSSHVKI